MWQLWNRYNKKYVLWLFSVFFSLPLLAAAPPGFLRPFSFQLVIPSPNKAPSAPLCLCIFLSSTCLHKQVAVKKGNRRLSPPAPRFFFKEPRPCEISRGAICFQNRNICSVKNSVVRAIWGKSSGNISPNKTLPCCVIWGRSGEIKGEKTDKGRLGTLNDAKLPLRMRDLLAARLTGVWAEHV